MQPRYSIIKGEYHIHYPDMPRQGPEPDGDTITFKPDDPCFVWRLDRFGRAAPDINTKGMCKVRFEGIDSLETHFQGRHQDLEFGLAARDLMLAQVGFTDIVYWDDLPNKIKSVNNHPRKGYLIANGVDVNGRVLAFAYAGEVAEEDGAPFLLGPNRMFQSLNVAVLDAGLAYASLYTTLPLSLAVELRNRAAAIRAAGTGMLAHEDLNTQLAAAIGGLGDMDEMVFWPKLFRRLKVYFSAGHPDLTLFDSWIREDEVNRDDRLLLPDGELGNLHDMYEVLDGQITLLHEPETVTMLPD